MSTRREVITLAPDYGYPLDCTLGLGHEKENAYAIAEAAVRKGSQRLLLTASECTNRYSQLKSNIWQHPGKSSRIGATLC